MPGGCFDLRLMSTMIDTHLEATVAALLRPGKGILAADESLPTIGRRFAALGIPSTAENRRAYRELLCTTPHLNECISGVILHDETTSQRTHQGETLPGVLTRRGIVPGVKVDGGTIDLANFAGEKITCGLDGLRERLLTYRELGARFTKWRAVIAIDHGRPTATCITANARVLALFAALSQEAGLVPIVEPEVLMAGDHTLARCGEVTGQTLEIVFTQLTEHRVILKGMLLKAGMVLSGQDCPQQAKAEEVAEATRRCLRSVVPAAVPGILFLSGGQSDVQATERLNAICLAGDTPWKLSFSFGRALQDAAMKTWGGSQDHAEAAQSALLHRARCNGLAVEGRYTSDAEHRDPAPLTGP